MQRLGKCDQRDRLKNMESDCQLTRETLVEWRETLVRVDSFFTVEPPAEAVWQAMS
jgi:hypothetical protein